MALLPRCQPRRAHSTVERLRTTRGRAGLSREWFGAGIVGAAWTFARGTPREDPATLSPKTRRPFSAKTIQGYRWCWDQVLARLTRGRDSILTDLTTGFVADFRARRRAAGASGPTINRNLTALSAFLTWCELEQGLTVPRPRLPHEREHPGRDRWLSADEIRALEGATPAEWWPLFALLIYTGLRIGEAQTLSWGSVRLAERRIAIGRQQQRVKTEASVRDVPISAPLAELLAAHRLRFPAGPADLVLPFPLSSYQRAQRAFQTACRRAGLHEVRPHDLRHTFGVHCARAGVPLARIQKLMGHATLAMTLRYLQHAPESYFARDAALVAESLSGRKDAEVEAAAELLRAGMRQPRGKVGSVARIFARSGGTAALDRFPRPLPILS
jgi:integrase